METPAQSLPLPFFPIWIQIRRFCIPGVVPGEVMTLIGCHQTYAGFLRKADEVRQNPLLLLNAVVLNLNIIMIRPNCSKYQRAVSFAPS